MSKNSLENQQNKQIDPLDLLAALKQKHDQTVAQKRELEEENQLLCEQISSLKNLDGHSLRESKKHAEQLERVIHFLRERVDGMQLELKQLTQQYEEAQNNFRNADEQLKSARTENEKLESEIEELKKGIIEKTCPPPINYAEELARVKQTLIRALRESQELQAHHQAVVAEKVALIGKWRQSQSFLEKEQQQQNILREQLEQISSLNSNLNKQVAEKEAELAAQTTAHTEIAERQERLIKQREDSILDLQRQVGLLRHEGEKARDELSAHYAALQAKDGDLFEAQQHLARKVKEVTELELQNEAKSKQIEEFQRLLQEDKIRIAELEASCGMHQTQQNQMQEQLAKWENKYLALYEKWQNAENRIKDLEKLEERYNQLQGLFSNMGNFLNVPAPVAPAPAAKEEKVVQPKPEPKTAEPKEKQPFSNLFDLPKTTTRPKHSFLE